MIINVSVRSYQVLERLVWAQIGRIANGRFLVSGGNNGVPFRRWKVAGTPFAVESVGSATAVRRAAVQFFPVMRQELVEPALLPSIGQLLEHIGEIWQRRHGVLGTGTHQAIERSGSAGGIV